MFFIGFECFSQTQQLPRYYIESGDTIGVILSIEQCQKIYNQQVLLELFEGYKFGCDSLMKKYFVIVNKYEQKQLVDKMLIEQHEKNQKDKDRTIAEYEKNEKNFNMDLTKCNSEIKLRDEKIANLNEINLQLKKQRNWLLGGTIGFGALTLYILGAITSK
jgi:hypothetical protein